MDIGNQALAIRLCLDLRWGVARVDDKAIHDHHPGHRVLVHPAGQRPVRVKLIHPKQLADLCGLVRSGALADAHQRAKVFHTHKGLGGAVAEEVDTAEGIDDAAGPCCRLAPQQW